MYVNLLNCFQEQENGNALEKREILASTMKWADKYGDIWDLWFGIGVGPDVTAGPVVVFRIFLLSVSRTKSPSYFHLSTLPTARQYSLIGVSSLSSGKGGLL